MVHVEGKYCPFVAHRCEAFVGADPTPSKKLRRKDRLRRCERFADKLICEGRPAALSFCIDKYEYPNLPGAKPVVMVDYREARRACKLEDKRLCEAEEWIFACEGPRTLPYPTGLSRAPGICNIDRRPRTPNREALSKPHDVSVELERLDQRMPAGGLPACKSPFGVFDTSGNVAEWVHDREAELYGSAIAGGHYARAVATCRLLETGVHPGRERHHTGFRCCRDPLDGRRSRLLLPKGFRLPKRRAIRK